MVDKMKISADKDLLERFKKYHEKERAWGSLHIVLDDNNYSNDCVEFCIQVAIEKQDKEGEELARILLQCSKTQRNKIAMLA